MKTNKHNILVLSDLKRGSESILKSTVHLAKRIDANIKLLHVKKPIDIVKQESQLSAMRTLNKEHNVLAKKMTALIEPFQGENNVVISTSFSIGNLRNEIEKEISNNHYDLIVLGKRKNKALKFVGDNVTDFILSNFKGTVLIPTKDNCLELGENANYGIVHNSTQELHSDLSKKLLKASNRPLKAYRVIDKNNDITSSTSQEMKTIEYAFEQNDNALKNVSNYINKHNINLLFVDRKGLKNQNQSTAISAEVKQLINRTAVPVLIS